MDEKDRLNLKNMVKSYGSDDNTGKIRSLRHSSKIKENVEILLNLKKKYAKMKRDNPQKFKNLATSHCKFLFTKYTNIFNKLLKDEIDIRILLTFINTLKRVENGEVDQNEASVLVGKILKELYIDSALKSEKNFEEKEAKSNKQNKKKKEKKPVNNISWAKFKKMRLND
tara:strand:+ start:730 stop:1239 length:510 start_codon:yes stop_codon:yes gene_type:complete